MTVQVEPGEEEEEPESSETEKNDTSTEHCLPLEVSSEESSAEKIPLDTINEETESSREPSRMFGPHSDQKSHNVLSTPKSDHLETGSCNRLGENLPGSEFEGREVGLDNEVDREMGPDVGEEGKGASQSAKLDSPATAGDEQATSGEVESNQGPTEPEVDDKPSEEPVADPQPPQDQSDQS